MTRERPDFSDLAARVVSAALMLVIGLGAMWIGGDVWGVVLIVAAGLMGWEVSRLHGAADQVRVIFGLLLAAAVLCWLFIAPSWAATCAVLIAGAGLAAHDRPLSLMAWAAAIGVSTAVLFELRAEWGRAVTLWVLLVVVVTDVGGYFAGKLIGGPKILPRISPKKTWSGTIGGWVLAALVGAGAAWLGLGGWWLVPVSVLLALAAQAGDILESRMKRRAGVKDSSSLIPGHGGLLDRFDGTVGACVALAVVWAIGVSF